MNDAKDLSDSGMRDLVWIAVPRSMSPVSVGEHEPGRMSALCLYKHGDWAVTTIAAPLADRFDTRSPVLNPAVPFAITHLPSGMKSESRPCFYSAMLLADGYAQAFAGLDPRQVEPQQRAALTSQAREHATARIREVAQVLERQDGLLQRVVDGTRERAGPSFDRAGAR